MHITFVLTILSRHTHYSS